jgi:hypothetical protein
LPHPGGRYPSPSIAGISDALNMVTIQRISAIAATILAQFGVSGAADHFGAHFWTRNANTIERVINASFQ